MNRSISEGPEVLSAKARPGRVSLPNSRQRPDLLLTFPKKVRDSTEVTKERKNSAFLSAACEYATNPK